MEKIHKTNAEWRELLPDDVYYITREAGTERPYTGRYMIFMKQAIIAVRVAMLCCSPIRPNSTVIVVGPLFLPRPNPKPPTALLTAVTAWCAKKCAAAHAMPI